MRRAVITLVTLFFTSTVVAAGQTSREKQITATEILDNQYYLVFQATPQKKAGLQRVNISTEIADVEIAAANSVWVPAAGEAVGAKKN